MNSNSQNTQDYYNLLMDQSGNSSAPPQILNNNNNENIQHTSTNDVGISNMSLNALHNINIATPAPQNVTFEFYFPLPNDTRICHVTYQYTELHPLENARRLNDKINLSHIPDYQLSHHYNLQSLIQQQIQQQQLQHPVYQQNDIQQQSLDTTQSTSQVYSNNDTYSNTASILVNGTVSYSMQDGFQNSS
ncbi:hypothetical protein RhiirA4_480172 [Rhizophagus irregularis]|uniref:Uncharacterized protein n=1 Tax=Rhizophagus irregularis TaxID=588596 RepID=A0A2I1HHP0_9GLOM|nr:hypothetical protein RhiirA4_480172 [Rhizophagus irregularis]